MDEKVLRRFWAKTQITDGCWEWTAARNGSGYANLWVETRMEFAHRLAYEHFIGPVPQDHEVDHLCFNKACVNPEHLEAVTASTNTKRAWDAGRCQGNAKTPFEGDRLTTCRRGHRYEDSSTYVEPNGARRCRICRNADQAERRARVRG